MLNDNSIKRLIPSDLSKKFIQMIKHRLVSGSLPCKEEFLLISSDRSAEISEWYNNIFNLEFIKNEFQTNELEEIIIHGPRQIQVFLGQTSEQKNIHLSSDEFETSLEILAFRYGEDWNHRHSFVSFSIKLFDRQVRLSLMHKSLSPYQQSKAFFRLSKNIPLSIERFGHQSQNLQKIVKSKQNIIVVGPSGSGKTTLMHSLCTQFNNWEHPVIIEDTHELHSQHSNVTHFLVNNENSDMKSALEYSLRMRPDRIVLGEIRGAEVIPMILALYSGHNGFLTSFHARDPKEAIVRLAMLYLTYAKSTEISYNSVFQIICQAIDIIIIIKNKKIEQICKLMGSEEGQPYYQEYGGEIDSPLN